MFDSQPGNSLEEAYNDTKNKKYLEKKDHSDEQWVDMTTGQPVSEEERKKINDENNE